MLQHGADHASVTRLTKSEGGPGTQALHFAAEGGHESVVTLLLDAGANPNAEGRYGRTPLTSALGEGKLACAKLLLNRGALASVKPKHKQFDPPLVVLASGISNTTSMVARNGKLVPAGKDYWDQQPAVLEMIQLLLAAGADPNATGSHGDVPLVYLARRIPPENSIPIARMLIEKGANPDGAGKKPDPPLMMAAICNSTAMGRLLLEHPVDLNRLCPRGTVLDVVEGNAASAKRDLALARGEIRAELQAILEDLNSFRDLLISRGAKHKTELGEVVEPPKKREVRHIASDFLKLVNRGEAEWSLLAVKAPFEDVVQAYRKYAKVKSIQEKMAIRLAEEAQEIAPLTAVIQVKDSPWTIILRTIFYVRMPDIKHVSAAARELSKSLETGAVSWCGTDETDNGRCELFKSGERTATAGSAKSIAMLTAQAVHVPACYPTHKDGHAWLAVEKESLSMVELANLLAR